jgi:hypothetical protein
MYSARITLFLFVSLLAKNLITKSSKKNIDSSFLSKTSICDLNDFSSFI